MARQNDLRNQLNELESISETYYQTSQEQLINKEIELDNEKNNNQLIQTQLNDYLSELNELDKDYQIQEELLADKNAKLAQVIAEKDNLQIQLLSEKNISQGLQDKIDNHACPVIAPHTCPTCPLIHLPEPHACPIVKKTDCSHVDYETIKEQRDNYQSQLIKQEKEITQQLNNSLNLNLQEPNLEQVISRIQQLISKPPKEIYQEFNDGELEQELNQAKQTISRLEKELTPFGEDLVVIKELELTSLEQLFNQAIDSDIQQQITQATSYQQVVSARQAFIQQQLGERQNIAQVVNQPSQELNKPLNQEKVILISALVASLLTVGGLMMKLKAKKEK